MNPAIQLVIALSIIGLFVIALDIECKIIGKTACYHQNIKYEQEFKAL